MQHSEANKPYCTHTSYPSVRNKVENFFHPQALGLGELGGEHLGNYIHFRQCFKEQGCFFAATHSKYRSSGTVWYKANLNWHLTHPSHLMSVQPVGLWVRLFHILLRKVLGHFACSLIIIIIKKQLSFSIAGTRGMHCRQALTGIHIPPRRWVSIPWQLKLAITSYQLLINASGASESLLAPHYNSLETCSGDFVQTLCSHGTVLHLEIQAPHFQEADEQSSQATQALI